MTSAPCRHRRILASLVLVVAFAAFSVDSAFAQPQNPPSAPVTVVNTTANPVPVRAAAPLPVTGTINVTEPVTVLETFAAGRSPKRYGPVDGTFTGNLVGHELVPSVAAGSTFIVTHLHAVGFSNNSAVRLVRASCSFLLRVGTLYTPFLVMPMDNSIGALGDTKPMFLPLGADEGLFVLCSGVAADGSSPPQGFRVTAGGYFVPSAQ